MDRHTGWLPQENQTIFPSPNYFSFEKNISWKLFRIFDDHDAETKLHSPSQTQEPRGGGERAQVQTAETWSQESEGATGNGFQQNLWKQWLAPGPWTHWLRPNHNNLNICIIWLNNHIPCRNDTGPIWFFVKSKRKDRDIIWQLELNSYFENRICISGSEANPSRSPPMLKHVSDINLSPEDRRSWGMCQKYEIYNKFPDSSSWLKSESCGVIDWFAVGRGERQPP